MSLTPYTPPTGNDMQAMIQVSQMLSKSTLVPSAYRGKPENVLLATLAGQPFGWDPTMSMRSFHVIEGQPSMKPEIMLALVRRDGHSVSGDTSPTGATITGKRRDTGDTMTVTFSMEDAKRAGLLGRRGPWQQYPQSMCWARAVSQLCRMLFPDVVLGAGYTPDELGGETHVDDIQVATQIPQVEIAEADLINYVSQRDAKKQLMAVLTDGGVDKDTAKETAANIWSQFGFEKLQTLESIEVEEFDEALAAARTYVEVIGADDEEPSEYDIEPVEAELVEEDPVA